MVVSGRSVCGRVIFGVAPLLNPTARLNDGLNVFKACERMFLVDSVLTFSILGSISSHSIINYPVLISRLPPRLVYT